MVRSELGARQCFICREWTWDVCKSMNDVELCLPCYVDILEVRQDRLEARGVMGGESLKEKGSTEQPGNSPSPFVQGDLFD